MGRDSRDGHATKNNRSGRYVPSDEVTRFWSQVDRRWRHRCWLWTGSIDRDGYPVFRVKRGGRWRTVPAHRYAYELVYGPIPGALPLDHDCHSRSRRCPPGPCRHRRCVRPEHLEPVTVAENLRRARNRRRR